jgi:hypothetical protein
MANEVEKRAVSYRRTNQDVSAPVKSDGIRGKTADEIIVETRGPAVKDLSSLPMARGPGKVDAAVGVAPRVHAENIRLNHPVAPPAAAFATENGPMATLIGERRFLSASAPTQPTHAALEKAMSQLPPTDRRTNEWKSYKAMIALLRPLHAMKDHINAIMVGQQSG